MEKIKILIIEDEESINNIVKSYLVKEGYEVYQAFDGEEGLKKFLSEDIDLVIPVSYTHLTLPTSDLV